MRKLRLDSVLGLAMTLAMGLAPSAHAQDKTIKIATQTPLSGGQAALGEGIKLGTQLALDKFKGNLEKQHFKVVLVPYDDQAKPDVGVSNAQNIIADQQILGVIGHLNSGVAIPSSEVYKTVNLAMISPANTNPTVTDRGYKDVFRVCGRDDVQGVVGSEFAHDALKAKSGGSRSSASRARRRSRTSTRSSLRSGRRTPTSFTSAASTSRRRPSSSRPARRA